MTYPKNQAYMLLKNLVEALDSSFWSSWQTTSDFQKQWDEASEFLEETKND